MDGSADGTALGGLIGAIVEGDEVGLEEHVGYFPSLTEF